MNSIDLPLSLSSCSILSIFTNVSYLHEALYLLEELHLIKEERRQLTLTSELKSFALNLGADRVGVVSIESLKDAPEGRRVEDIGTNQASDPKPG